MANQFSLLSKKKFLPLFVTQSLGAFNDNVFKNALLIMLTFITAEESGMSPELIVTIAGGLFILPFFLFSATAGQISDKYEKSRLIRIIKLIEIILMITASIGFYIGNVWFLVAILFLMGVQSTFFGPLKYSILPDHLEEDELIAGNAVIEAGTFLAILLGTILGGIFIPLENGAFIISIIITIIAIIGWISSRSIPIAPAAAPDLEINWNIITETWNIMLFTRGNRSVFLSIIGISWFWLVGATFLTQFPTYATNIIGGNENIITLFLTVFSLGIGLGSLFCNKLLKGEINAKYVPLGCIGMSIFMVDLYFASNAYPIEIQTFSLEKVKELIGIENKVGIGQFLSTFSGWRVLFDLTMIAIFGGIYIVPLYAIMQSRSEESHRARVIASNNIMNALFMVFGAIAAMLMFKFNLTVTEIFLALAILNCGVYFVVKKLVRKHSKG